MHRFDVDLYSDTKSPISAAMRQAMMTAEPGDEQHGECPIVASLTARTAQMLGKEAAVFLPSGTMANEIAILAQCRPGDEVLAHRDSHILNFEAGGVAALAGVMVRPLEGERGIFDCETLAWAIRRRARHLPRSRAVVIEQTANLGGGTVWPLSHMRDIAQLAHDAGLAVHVDGARLMNAAVASGTDPRLYGALADTIYLDFTKGLGAPFGAVLAGDAALIDEAWRWKQRLGGAMRQAGLMAAGCLHALDHHIDRLAEDHDHAAVLGAGLAALPGLRTGPVETNMVYVDVAGSGMTAQAFDSALWRHGVRMSVQGATVLRAVTHSGIDREGIDRALAAAAQVLHERGRPV